MIVDFADHEISGKGIGCGDEMGGSESGPFTRSGADAGQERSRRADGRAIARASFRVNRAALESRIAAIAGDVNCPAGIGVPDGDCGSWNDLAAVLGVGRGICSGEDVVGTKLVEENRGAGGEVACQLLIDERIELVDGIYGRFLPRVSPAGSFDVHRGAEVARDLGKAGDVCG